MIEKWRIYMDGKLVKEYRRRSDTTKYVARHYHQDHMNITYWFEGRWVSASSYHCENKGIEAWFGFDNTRELKEIS